MNKYLYFKSGAFGSNYDFAVWLHQELLDEGKKAHDPINEEYMFVIPVQDDGVLINIYLGKNDEQCSPPMWQVWPEQKVGFFEKFFGSPSLEHEDQLRTQIEKIVTRIDDASEIEWSNV